MPTSRRAPSRLDKPPLGPGLGPGPELGGPGGPGPGSGSGLGPRSAPGSDPGPPLLAAARHTYYYWLLTLPLTWQAQVLLLVRLSRLRDAAAHPRAPADAARTGGGHGGAARAAHRLRCDAAPRTLTLTPTLTLALTLPRTLTLTRRERLRPTEPQLHTLPSDH